MKLNGVNARENESTERLISRFEKVCNNAGLLSELKQYKHYEKPSEIRNRTKQSIKRKKLLKDRPIKTKRNKKRF